MAKVSFRAINFRADSLDKIGKIVSIVEEYQRQDRLRAVVRGLMEGDDDEG